MRVKLKVGLSENMGFWTGTIMALVAIKLWLMPWMSWGEVVRYVVGILVRISL